MQHTFRQSPFHKEASVRVTENSIQLLNNAGAIKREILFEDVVKVQFYVGRTTVTSEGKSLTCMCARIFPKAGRSIFFVSSLLQNLEHRESETNNLRDSFFEVLNKVKGEVCIHNPDAVLIYGDLGYAILLYTMTIMFGVLFLATLSLVLLSPLISLYSSRMAHKLSLAEGWIFIIPMLLLSFKFACSFWITAQSYKPRRIHFSEL